MSPDQEPEPATPVGPRTDPGPPTWLMVLVAGLVAAALRLTVAGGIAPLLSVAIGALTGGVMLRHAAGTSGRSRRAWTLFGLSVLAGGSSMALYSLGGTPAVDATRTALDASAYLLGIVGIAFFVLDTGGSDADAWLDAAAIGVALSLILFEFVIEPASVAAVTGRTELFALGVAGVDAAIFTCVARFVIRPVASRTMSLLGLIIAIALVIDAGYYTATGGLGIARPTYEAMWYVAYAAWAAGAVHPAINRITGGMPVPIHYRTEMRSSVTAIGIHSAGFVVTMVLQWHHVSAQPESSALLFAAAFVIQIALVASRSYRIVRRLADDVERRVAVEEALRESEDRFRGLTDVAPVGIFVSDAAGRSIFQNKAWEEISGIRPEAALGDGYAESIHPDDRAWAMAEWLACVREEREMRIEHRLLRPDGGVRWVSSRAIPTRDEAGTLTGWVGTIADVTGLVEARTEAQEAAAFVTDLIDQSPVGIHVYAPDGHTISMNPAKTRIRERILGPSSSVAMPALDVRLDPLMARMFQADAIAVAFGGRPVQTPESVRVTPAAGPSPGDVGDDVWLRISWYPVLDDDGALTAVISFTEDVTEAALAQEQQKRVEARLAEASQYQALTVLAGGIAHDFNNLLGAILGRANLARSTSLPGSAVDRDLEAIEVAAVRAAGLARQILAYAGRGRYAVERAHLGNVVRDGLEAIGGSIDPQAVLDVSYAPDLEAVEVDPTQVRQLVLNLVANASEALERRPGRITVRTGRHRLVADDPELIAGTPLDPGPYVTLEVEDDGHGMDEKTLARVFAPFFTTKAVGRGLGLAAALGIAKAHDAGIRVRSTPGKGTRVQVLFRPAPAMLAVEPAAAPAPATGTGPVGREATSPSTPSNSSAASLVSPNAPMAPVAVGPSEGFAHGTVLVVDDEPTVRAVARRVLERAGYRVVEAAGGAEGIGNLEADPGRWSAAVVDLTMPDVDGVAVVTRIRELRPDLAVVVCSGWAAQEVAERLGDVQAVVFLEKPYRPGELLAALASSRAAAGVPGMEGGASAPRQATGQASDIQAGDIQAGDRPA